MLVLGDGANKVTSSGTIQYVTSGSGDDVIVITGHTVETDLGAGNDHYTGSNFGDIVVDGAGSASGLYHCCHMTIKYPISAIRVRELRVPRTKLFIVRAVCCLITQRGAIFYRRVMLLAGQERYPCNDVGEMEHLLRVNAGATRFEASACAQDFKFNVNIGRLSSIALIWSTCNVATTIRYSSATFVRQIFPIRQPISVALEENGSSYQISKLACLIPGERDWQLYNGSNFESLALRVEIAALECCLQAMIGADCQGRLRFEGGDCGDPRLTRMLRNAVFQFANEVDYATQTFSFIALRELERDLVLKFLLCNPHNYSNVLNLAHLPREDANVRRVEEFIAANWSKPIDVQTLAAVSGTSERSLFRAFRKQHGHSPYAFIKRVRLERAREMLSQDSGDVSVMDVALKCNFHSVGRFAADYRRTFGELPSETLLNRRSHKRASARGPSDGRE